MVKQYLERLIGTTSRKPMITPILPWQIVKKDEETKVITRKEFKA